MNKVLILIGAILWIMLVVVNFAASTWPDFTFTWWWDPWMLALNWVISWILIWYWLKWFLSEKKWVNYDDEWINF